MRTFRIYDLDGQVLALDLRHLIDLLAPRSLEASWTISVVKSPDFEWFDATGEGGEELDRLAQTGSTITGSALAELARNTRQVIWGKFTGTLPGKDKVWVTIRAIDSTFYEVTSSDEIVSRKIKSAYKDVQLAERPYD